jgi:hypothetical protein
LTDGGARVPHRDFEKRGLDGGAALGLRPGFAHFARHGRPSMRHLNTNELTAVAGGVNPHLVVVTTNPGGVVNKSVLSNPNTQTFTYKTTGKPA